MRKIVLVSAAMLLVALATNAASAGGTLTCGNNMTCHILGPTVSISGPVTPANGLSGQTLATVKGATLTVTDILVGNQDTQSSCIFAFGNGAASTAFSSPILGGVVQPGATLAINLKTGLTYKENTSISFAVVTLGFSSCAGFVTIIGAF